MKVGQQAERTCCPQGLQNWNARLRPHPANALADRIRYDNEVFNRFSTLNTPRWKRLVFRIDGWGPWHRSRRTSVASLASLVAILDIALVGSLGTVATGTTSASPTFGQSTTAGNLLIAWVTGQVNGGTNPIVVTGASG
jgi:hypothetical protein